jgi:DNA repair photolyase
LLAHSKVPDPLFGIKYTMNIYRGCQHQCIYCDSRSECYQIEDFTDVLVKVNTLELLTKELKSKRIRGTIGTGSMSDPYIPVEAHYRLTERALQIIAENRFPVHAITKSDMVVRDREVLRSIGQVYAAVSFTITTADDDLARKLEPGAPPPSARFRAMAALAAAGIYTGVTMMPILPYIEDTEDNVAAIAERARDCGASYILPWFGMTLRDRQRAYYYNKLDGLFPGLSTRYQQRYGERYECPTSNAARLDQMFGELCARYGLARRMRHYTPEPIHAQLSLFA